MLFLLYINDIVDVVNPGVQIRLFADDCILYKNVNSATDQDDLNNSLGNILKWCDEWGMILNANKCVYLPVTRKKTTLKHVYKLGSLPLEEVNNYKYLGVTLTNNLSWNLHINNVCSSAFRKLCYLKHKLKSAPPSVKLLAYVALIRPKLEYACTVWDPYTEVNIDNLERIQRKAVRFIHNKFSRTDSPSELMKINDLPLLKIRRQQFRLDFLSLLVGNKLALDPSLFVSPLTTRVTRHRQPHALTPYFARTNLFKFSFFPRTISEWNDLATTNVLS